MAEHLDLVRYRNDGDDFHVLWTARRILRLFDPASSLVAVSVEGISEREDMQSPTPHKGLLVVDTAEYYGSQEVRNAKKVVYCQLKYSTKAPNKEWTLGGLKDTLEKFSLCFRKLQQKYGASLVKERIRFQFVTNRPVASGISRIFAEDMQVPLKRDARGTAAYNKVRAITGLDEKDFKLFASIVIIAERQSTRIIQTKELEDEIRRLTSHTDFAAVASIKEFVRSKTLSDSSHDKTIVRETLLNHFGLHENDLLPAPPYLEPIAKTIPRSQENEILKSILESTTPVVVHASGGMGKTILAQRIKELLLDGSETIIFDGFASGAYRSPTKRRHLHSKGLVQIANTLAAKGLCDILLPRSGASDDALLNAFNLRLCQASLAVRRRSPNAKVLIILDAADNSVGAANEHNEKSFVRDLLQEPPPHGCRLVALARTERLERLDLPSQTTLIKLNPFNEGETASHLRKRFKDASEDDVKQFHRFTDSNPRVQANAIASYENLSKLIGSLGPSPRTVEHLIQSQLDEALGKLEDIGGKLAAKEIRTLCTSLAILPPFVPINTLATVSGIQSESVRSFVSDFGGGRYVLIHNGSIQFRDEPVESWFRERFATSVKHYKRVISLLRPESQRDIYIAMILPQLLLKAEEYADLVTLALSEAQYPNVGPVERREIILNRVRYALKAAVVKKCTEDVAKLMFRAGEETAAEERQIQFLIENLDLVGKLAGGETVHDFVFRKRAWQFGENGYVNCSAMLANTPNKKAEAKHFLGLGMAWLRNWLSTPAEKRSDISDSVIGNITYTIFNLQGPEKAAAFLSRWVPKTISFKIGQDLARRFLDSGDKKACLDWLTSAGNDIHLKLGVFVELSRLNLLPEEKHVLDVLGLLLRSRLELPEGERVLDDMHCAIAAVAECAAIHSLPRARVLQVLRKYRPPHPRPFGHWDRPRREAILRFAALDSALTGVELTPDGIVPDSIRTEISKPGAEHNQEIQKFTRAYGALLPWYILRGQFFAGVVAKAGVPSRCALLGKAFFSERSWHSEDNEWLGVINEVPVLWLDLQLLSRGRNLSLLRKYIKQQKRIFTTTYASLARASAQYSFAKKDALAFAHRAKTIVLAEHTDAHQTARSLIGLARAVLAVSPQEAEAYFRLALDNLGGVGDEMYDRLFGLLAIATSAAKEGGRNPKEAYRLSRVAEAFNASYSDNFPWYQVTQVITALCPSSGLAIVSRWHDRRQSYLDTTLPAVILKLLERKQISTQTAIAFHLFPGTWRDGEGLAMSLFDVKKKEHLQRMFACLVSDLEHSERSGENIKALIAVAEKFRFEHVRLTKLQEHGSRAKNEHTGPSQKGFLVKNSARNQKPTKWGTIFHSCNLLTPGGISRCIEKYRSCGTPWHWEVLYPQMRRRVPPSGWAAHIEAISRAPLEFWQILDMLEGIAADWDTSHAAELAVAEAIKHILNEQPLGLAKGRWISSRDLDRCVKLSKLSKREALDLLTLGLGSRPDSVPAAAWFHLAGEVSSLSLSHEEANRVLKFALDRLDPVLKSTDGDGDWCDDLRPPRNIPDAVARLLYVLLSSANSEDRWRAAHAVRRLCDLECGAEVSAIIGLRDTISLKAFTDRRFPFYRRHGRLYLVIALARVALDNPSILRKYFNVFVAMALDEEPHVIVQYFSSAAAINIAHAFPGVCSKNSLARLRSVNKSPLPRAPSRDYGQIGWVDGFRKYRGVYLGYDFERYWLGPFAEVFNLKVKQVAPLVIKQIVDHWGEEYKSAWDDDPRADAGHFKHLNTEPDHGSYPGSDRLTFYQCYHAMMIVAGELLRKYPTALDRWGGQERWPAWLQGHLLTRPDGKWLSDRRDFEPIALAQGPLSGADEKHWRWSIQAANFDYALGLNCKKPKRISVWGSYSKSHGYKSEDVSVRTALVSAATSVQLMEDLQTAKSRFEYGIPGERGQNGFSSIPFKINGWIAEDSVDRGIDRFDPLSGNIRYPAPKPGRLARRLFELKSQDDGRVWLCAGKPVIWSILWGEERARREEKSDAGHWMFTDIRFIRQFLSRIGQDLLIQVEIVREDKYDNSPKMEYSHKFHTRLYVLRADGSIHTTREIRKLWR